MRAAIPLAYRLLLTGSPLPVAPVLNTPTISGTVQESQTLTAVYSYANPQPYPAPSVTFQWQYSTDGSTGWTNVASAGTSVTYSVDDTYAGYFLRVQVSASNSSGSDSKNSAATVRVDTLYFGNGSDGDLTSSSPSTISVSKKYRDWTINTNIGITTSGSILLQVCRTLTGGNAASVIHANGNNGTNSTATGGPHAGAAGGTGRNSGGDGGQGGTSGDTNGDGATAGGNGTGVTNGSDGTGGTGGCGSDTNSTQNGGGGGSAVRNSTPNAKSQIRDDTGSYTGGGGGGGGGGGAWIIKTWTDYNGPGGGEGAGVVRVLAKSIAGSGTFQAKGGNAGNADGSSSGAGGGGGGRVLLGSYSANSASWTIDVTGGLKSASYSTALPNPQPTDGTAGSSYEDYGAGD